jgi:flavin reductase (DIM6/NTAB) family NADH-FMN oxidoreductase RutF
MEYAANALTPHERYKLLAGFVLPRPIAWVTTVGPTGVVNAAPFSFFNVFCEDPPLCMFAVGPTAAPRTPWSTSGVRENSWSTSPMSRWRMPCTIPAATFRPRSASPAISA